MDKPIIDVRGVSKKYILSHQQVPYETLRDTLTELAKKPFRKILRRPQIQKEDFWALNDINFTVNKGEAIGLIGANGSGKSTLLKILSQITQPTTGEITIHGHIASLLEVGTGFHPELTGRENIFLNGAILGMTRSEITKKFNDIVEFSGVEKFLDTPVKRYSSGMYVRLAFSVAAHLEPEILLIDEVLSVGDAEFQKKCLGKMDEVTHDNGRTIIFVSHNMEAIKRLCSKCILLKEGQIEMIGDTNLVVDHYLRRLYHTSGDSLVHRPDRIGEGKVRYTRVDISSIEHGDRIQSGDRLRISLQYDSSFQKHLLGVRAVISILNEDLHPVLRFDSYVTTHTYDANISPRGNILCETYPVQLMEGRYFASVDLLMHHVVEDSIAIAAELRVETRLADFDFKLQADTGINFIKYRFSQSE